MGRGGKQGSSVRTVARGVAPSLRQLVLVVVVVAGGAAVVVVVSGGTTAFGTARPWSGGASASGLFSTCTRVPAETSSA